MSSLRPDGRAPGAPLHTHPDDEGKPSTQSIPSTPKMTSGAGDTATDAVDARVPPSGERLARASSESLRLKKPEATQYVGPKSVPVTGTTKKAEGAQAPALQKQTAEMLVAAGRGEADTATQALCHAMLGMTTKPEGFKTLVAARPGADWHGLMCHDPSQLKNAKGDEHQKLAANLASAYSTSQAMRLGEASAAEQKKASVGLRNELFKGSMSPKPDGSCGIKGLYFAGTRLVQESGSFVLSPSARYLFNADALGDRALLDVARAHAGLLLGAHIAADKLTCHPDHPTMQVLVDAIKAQMAAA